MSQQPPKASLDQLDNLGRIAAEMVNAGDHVGLGSGRAAIAFTRALGRRVQKEHLPIIAVSTSLATEKVAREFDIPLATLVDVTELDIAIDGADEVDPSMNLLKGGGGNLTREKVIENIARRLIIVVGQEKIVDHLGSNFPVFVEVIEFARPLVTRQLMAMGGEVVQRMNADGSAFLTDNRNPYLEVRFGPPPHHLANPHETDRAIRALPGVVETGLFINMADEILIAHVDGNVEHRK